MNKYLNIFHSNNSKECYIVDGDSSDGTKRIDVGEKLKVYLSGDDDFSEGTLEYDNDMQEYYLEINGKKYYSIQGMKVL